MQHSFSTPKAWCTSAIITRIYKTFWSIPKESVHEGRCREKNLQCRMTHVEIWGRSKTVLKKSVDAPPRSVSRGARLHSGPNLGHPEPLIGGAAL